MNYLKYVGLVGLLSSIVGCSVEKVEIPRSKDVVQTMPSTRSSETQPSSTQPIEKSDLNWFNGKGRDNSDYEIVLRVPKGKMREKAVECYVNTIKEVQRNIIASGSFSYRFIEGLDQEELVIRSKGNEDKFTFNIFRRSEKRVLADPTIRYYGWRISRVLEKWESVEDGYPIPKFDGLNMERYGNIKGIWEKIRKKRMEKLRVD
ncbi:MAG: hypothetical protein KKF56_02355 [Nanoarchaeota archaeon]|nr:hypothetical protein [Nanoarchaeota archaeon]